MAKLIILLLIAALSALGLALSLKKQTRDLRWAVSFSIVLLSSALKLVGG